MIEVKKPFRINPVLRKELKVKMRSWKAPIMIGVYNLILALLTIFMIMVTVGNSFIGPNQQMIIAVYTFMVIAQFGLISLIAPALTAGAISGEREKQTLDILLSTTLHHWSIIVGKLFASLSQVIILIISSIPIYSIIFLYGGLGVMDLIQVFGFYLVIAIMLGSIGIFFSTFIKKSTASNVLSYALTIFFYLGTILISVFYVQIVIRPDYSLQNNDVFWLYYLNPAISLFSMLMSQFSQSGGYLFPGLSLNPSNSTIPFWAINLLFDLVFSAIILWLSAIKLNPIKKKFFATVRGERVDVE